MLELEDGSSCRNEPSLHHPCHSSFISPHCQKRQTSYTHGLLVSPSNLHQPPPNLQSFHRPFQRRDTETSVQPTQLALQEFYWELPYLNSALAPGTYLRREASGDNGERPTIPWDILRCHHA